MELKTNFKSEIFETDNNYSEVQECVKDIIKKEGYVSYNIKKKVFTPDGGSFLGILCEIDIEGETAESKQETNIFMKIKTPDAQMTMISLLEAYKNELFVYNELAKIYTELQNEVHMPAEEKYNFVKSHDESNPNVIILENLIKREFKTNFRMDVITLQYAEMAVAKLAKFHALSFVLELKRPNYYERKIKTIKSTFSFDDDWDGFVQNMCQITLNYLDNDSRRKLKDFIPHFNEKYRKYLGDKNARLCLRHGDYRPNNILVKETNGVISGMIPIDFQLVSYECPVLDFIFFIFSSTDRKFRRSHLSNLKDLYYKSLRRFLKHFSLDVTTVYPRAEFENNYDAMLDYGLMTSLLLIPLLMTCDSNVEITGEPAADLNFGVTDQCEERLVGIVQDFIDWGYL